MVPRAIVNRRVLIKARGDLAGIHLDSIPWDGSAISFLVKPPPQADKGQDSMFGQDLVDGGQGKVEPMNSSQFILDAVSSRISILTKIQNPLLLFGENLFCRRMDRPSISTKQTLQTPILISS